MAFPLVCRAIFRRLGRSPADAWAAALALLGVPLAFGALNPAAQALLNWSIGSGAIRWLAMPELTTPAVLRTPEPQFSLLLLAVGVLVALKRRAHWPVYPALAFMYPFVAFPAAFALVAAHLHAAWPARWRARAWAPLAIAFVAIAAPAALYFRFVIDAHTRLLMAPSFAPLISLTGALALAAWALLRQRMPEPLRFPALAIALAPWAACNQQLLSGYVGQPSNFEQYAGTFAVTLVWLLAIGGRPRVRVLTVAVAALFFARSAYVTFRTNQITNDRLPLTPAIVEALRRSPENVVVNDLPLASVLNMVHPRQGSTALGMEKIYGRYADRWIADYRCVKHQALAEHPDDAGLKRAFAYLDVGYALGGQDAVKVHIQRKTHFETLRDVSAMPCPPRPLRYELLP